jgi:imidazolonepropionase-like amidohydrolase
MGSLQVRLQALIVVPLMGASLLQATVAATTSRVYPPVVITHVSVLPMTRSGEVLRDMTVIIRDGRIDSISSPTEARIPHGIQQINGGGKWLIPALTDMHAHQENARTLQLITGNKAISPSMFDDEDLLLPFVYNGVLQIFNPAATAEQVGLRDEIEAGHLLAPHIELAAMVDGSPPIWPIGLSHVAVSPEDGRQFVRDMKADGFRFVKTYSKLDLDTFSAILDEARKQGIRVVGHIPGRGQGLTEKWLQPGYEMVMHSEEFAYQTSDPSHYTDNIARYVELAKQRGIYLCSTLTTDERILEQMRDPSVLLKRLEIRYVNPVTLMFWTSHSPYANASSETIAWVSHTVDFNRKLVKAFSDAGLPVFPGTDTVVPGMIAGFSLHDELESLAAAGLSPAQILITATRLSADFLGVGSDRGTIEVGKRADLVLLDADPIVDIANTRRIAAIIVGGRYLPRAQLDLMMNDLARRYGKVPPIRDDATAGQRVGGGYWDPFDDD